MLVHLRLTVPSDLVRKVLQALDDPAVIHLTHLRKASIRPAGDVIVADVAREAASDILDALRQCGLVDRGGITLQEVEGALSTDAERAERLAPGDPEDSVVWPMVIDKAAAESRGSWSFHVFLALGCALAAIAVITDSPILVVGAMVVSPDFAPVSAMAVGIALRQRSLLWRAARLLVTSYVSSILVVALLALVGRLLGVITIDQLTAPRPLTGFIWHPDLWSFIVALLAGAAGTLSVSTARSTALVGVFISVTTIPAAGNLALALALWHPSEMAGSGLQLVINLAGMLAAGVVTLLLLRFVAGRITAVQKKRAVSKSARR